MRAGPAGGAGWECPRSKELGGGLPAVLKLQLLDEESAGEPAALRARDGDGAVRLLEHDEPTGTLLLERLAPTRPLTGLPDTREAALVVARLPARLTSVPAPAGTRRPGDIARDMLERAPGPLGRLPGGDARRLLVDCAAAVREVVAEPGDRLLHWDLHYDNVLADGRGPWLAIDPEPLAGDVGFELFPALVDRFDATEAVPRFEVMTGVLGRDRDRARAWTLGRVPQNALWDLADGRPLSPEQLWIGRVLRA